MILRLSSGIVFALLPSVLFSPGISFSTCPWMRLLIVKRVFAAAYILASSIQLSTLSILLNPSFQFQMLFDSFISRQSSLSPLRRFSPLCSGHRLFLVPLPSSGPSRLRRSQIRSVVFLRSLVGMLRMRSIHLDRNLAEQYSRNEKVSGYRC